MKPAKIAAALVIAVFILILIALLTGCATSQKLPPAPSVEPVKMSNRMTTKSIVESKRHVEKTQVILKEQEHTIDTVIEDLNQLLKQ